MTTSEVGGVQSSTTGLHDLDLRDRGKGVSVSGAFGTPATGDELDTTDARFLLESDGLACCMTCGLVTRPWVVRLPDVNGTSAVVARCVACGTRGTVHSASHWVRVTRTAPNPSASIA
jgi:hypothetical protein